MSCNFLGESCTSTSPCCDGFNCNTEGICDFYKYSDTQKCPKGYSNVNITGSSGICALDLKTEGSWIIWIVIIIFCVVIVGLVLFVVYKIIKHRK